MYLVWLASRHARRTCGRRCSTTVAPTVARRSASATHDRRRRRARAGVPPLAPAARREPPVHAVVSLWLDAYDYRAPFEEILRAHADAIRRIPGRSSRCTATTAATSGREPRDWADGKRSPGLAHRDADPAEARHGVRGLDHVLARHGSRRCRRRSSRAPATCATRCSARSPPTRRRTARSSRRRGRRSTTSPIRCGSTAPTATAETHAGQHHDDDRARGHVHRLRHDPQPDP